MKYLLLVFYDEKVRNAMTEAESETLMEEAIQFDNKLRESGQLVAAHPLEGVHSAITVRSRRGKLKVTDGPFAETKEQIGGFLLIEARDLEEAKQIALRVPPARLGGVEVRPIIDMKQRPQTRMG
jgi:hypothetical protein